MTNKTFSNVLEFGNFIHDLPEKSDGLKFFDDLVQGLLKEPCQNKRGRLGKSLQNAYEKQLPSFLTEKDKENIKKSFNAEKVYVKIGGRTIMEF